jgi:hypothetical protein
VEDGPDQGKSEVQDQEVEGRGGGAGGGPESGRGNRYGQVEDGTDQGRSDVQGQDLEEGPGVGGGPQAGRGNRYGQVDEGPDQGRGGGGGEADDLAMDELPEGGVADSDWTLDAGDGLDTADSGADGDWTEAMGQDELSDSQPDDYEQMSSDALHEQEPAGDAGMDAMEAFEQQEW